MERRQKTRVNYAESSLSESVSDISTEEELAESEVTEEPNTQDIDFVEIDKTQNSEESFAPTQETADNAVENISDDQDSDVVILGSSIAPIEVPDTSPIYISEHSDHEMDDDREVIIVE
jgi:formaldehyde-activating enzyme involved in methanogenesis